MYMDTDILEEHAAARKRSEFAECDICYRKISDIFPNYEMLTVMNFRTVYSSELFDSIGMLLNYLTGCP
jgi:hypothetical protein